MSEVTLHSIGHTFQSVELSQGSEHATHVDSRLEVCTPDNITSGADGTIRLALSKPLQPGSVTIQISYQSTIGNSMVGFFRARYRPIHPPTAIVRDGDHAVLLVSQFEACYARTAFPCFDEPDLKATFDFEMEVPEVLTALSNMPVQNTVVLSGDKSGLKRVRFHRSPVMSTYLLAWAVGELEYIETWTEKEHGGSRVLVRVYTPLGLLKHAQLALECAAKVLDLFQRLFQVDYPISKSDHLIVPEFVCGAMENWGLITYKPTKVLFDPATSNNRVLSKAVYVIAHELAHQWFGNLVTMRDWSELWLNEGFATWAGYLAADILYPDWNIWGQYVAEIMDEVMKLDSLPTTHAIKMHVQNENEARQMFDQISYFKGSAVIRMLAAHLGQDVFLQGLSNYLKKHAYANASSEDLWSCLSEVSGVQVSAIMDSWIYTGSFPIVKPLKADNGHVLHQQRSILSPADDDKSGLEKWKIPSPAASKETNGNGIAKPVMLNTSHIWYACMDYDAETVQSIVQSQAALGSTDLPGVIMDMSTLVANNVKPTGHMLEFFSNIKQTSDCFAWLAMHRALASVLSVFSDDAPVMLGLRAYIADLISLAQAELQWDADPMTYTQAERYKSIIYLSFAAAGGNEADPVVKETKRRFSEWSSGKAGVLPASLRKAIFSCSVSVGSEDDFALVRNAFDTDDSLDGQEVFLDAMGSVSDPKLARKVLAFTFADDTLELQHVPLVGGILGQNNACKHIQWDYVTENWEQVSRRLGANPTCRDWWIEESLGHFSDEKMGEEIEAFLLQNIGAEVSKPLRTVRANITRQARYRQQSRQVLLDWLVGQGYTKA